MIKFKSKGDFTKTISYMNKASKAINLSILDKYGKMGVAALAAATPVDSGKTSKSWRYEITRTSKSATITFLNSNIQNGVPIAIILQYGHGTRNGGYVQGQDYINPALEPVFKRLSDEAWREVIKL